MSAKITTIIPARLNSKRFPRKVLAVLGGIPLVMHAYRNAEQAGDVYVVTPDEEVAQVVLGYGGQVFMEKRKNSNGTEAVAEAAEFLKLYDQDVIINLQADEPLVTSKVLEAVAKCIYGMKYKMATAMYRMEDYLHRFDSNRVKLVVTVDHEAMYFTRTPVATPWHHVGVYAFDGPTLALYDMLKPSPMEGVEQLEQLRALEHGIRIAVIESEPTIGVDSPGDLEEAEEIFHERN